MNLSRISVELVCWCTAVDLADACTSSFDRGFCSSNALDHDAKSATGRCSDHMSLEAVDSWNYNACHNRNDEHAKAGGQERRPAHTLAVGLCGARRPLDGSAALGGMRGGSGICSRT